MHAYLTAELTADGALNEDTYWPRSMCCTVSSSSDALGLTHLESMEASLMMSFCRVIHISGKVLMAQSLLGLQSSDNALQCSSRAAALCYCAGQKCALKIHVYSVIWKGRRNLS